MELSKTLLKIALLGTERQNQPPQGDAALQPWLAQLYPGGVVPPSPQREAAFLGAVALSRQYGAGGVLPARFDGVRPAAAPPDEGPLMAPAAATHLRWMLVDNGLRPLLDGWLEAVQARGLRIPPALIAPLLEAARASRAIRPAVSGVIGRRGHWLAAHNPDWARLLVTHLEADDDDPERPWREGNPAQRSEYLRALRARDPVRAREQLAAVWKQEAAQVRQALLAACAVGLSMNDEAWLESCLDDRSKGVRQLAAELLGALPDSAFARRQRERLAGWLGLEGGKGVLNTLTGRKPRLTVSPPEVWDAAWGRDGIEERPPQGKGARAWWLEQVLACVPPAHWCEQWGLTPAELLALTRKHEWEGPLLAGWQQALTRYPDAAWASAWLRLKQRNDEALWAVLPQDGREALALEFFREADGVRHHDIVHRLSPPWSPAFSLALCEVLARWRTQKLRGLYGLHEACRQIALHLHLDAHSALEAALQPALADAAHDWHGLAERTLQTLRLRAEMRAALDCPTDKD